MREECSFAPKINEPESHQGAQDGNVQQVRGVDKMVERMNKARQSQVEKKLMTERGMPSQLAASIGKPEQIMSFGCNTNKYKSGFGVDGSQLIPDKTKTRNFAASQRLDARQLKEGANSAYNSQQPTASQELVNINVNEVQKEMPKEEKPKSRKIS